MAYTPVAHCCLPHFTIDEKLSSRMTMSAASLATSVPAMPIAKPTSLSLSAGASFVPSPVTATTSPWCFSRLTSVSLSSGDERASTWRVSSLRGWVRAQVGWHRRTVRIAHASSAHAHCHAHSHAARCDGCVCMPHPIHTQSSQQRAWIVQMPLKPPHT
jgi:hypothetical protein